ncbi:hypothetical protein MNBD_GAMMA05-1215 [hydrothermal vent metagenome]|uniref:Phosphohistidine phosphatase SixA n=1 Tax=hydrothermal vent metagenome TaxID=652676 RepID=A0A3B0WRM3_9ZZZZ
MTINRLYFAQHGLAVDKTKNSDRPLSASGIEQTELMAAQLSKQQITISKIFHSGKLRASQTADIFAKRLSVAAVSAVDYLSPNSDISIVTALLDTDAALYVGHLPHIDKFTSTLLTGDENKSIIYFQNSGVLCLESTPQNFQVKWYLTPAQLVL